MLQATPVYEVLGLPPTSSFTHPPNTDKTKVRFGGCSSMGVGSSSGWVVNFSITYWAHGLRGTDF